MRSPDKRLRQAERQLDSSESFPGLPRTRRYHNDLACLRPTEGTGELRAFLGRTLTLSAEAQSLRCHIDIPMWESGGGHGPPPGLPGWLDLSAEAQGDHSASLELSRALSVFEKHPERRSRILGFCPGRVQALRITPQRASSLGRR